MIYMSESIHRDQSVFAIKKEFPEQEDLEIHAFCETHGILDSNTRIQPGEQENQLRIVVEDVDGNTIQSLSVGVSDSVLMVLSSYAPPGRELRRLLEV